METASYNLEATSVLNQEQQVSEVLYNIYCQDDKARRAKRFFLPRNPFEDSRFFEESKKSISSSAILGVFLDVHGSGSSYDWEYAIVKPPYAQRDEVFPHSYRRRRSPPPPPLSVPMQSWRPARVEGSSAFSSYSSSEDGDLNDVASNKHYDEQRQTDTADVEDSTENPPSPPKARGRINAIQELSNFQLTSIRVSSIEIYSKNILKLFQTLIVEYPSHNLNGASLMSNRPFALLAHYYHELLLLVDQGATETPENNAQPALQDSLNPPLNVTAIDQQTKSDVNVLLRVFSRVYLNDFQMEEERHNTGVASYKLLWFLYRPGSMVYGKVGGKLAGFVFRWGEEIVDDRRDNVKTLKLYCWSLVYDGRNIVRTNTTFSIREYEGVRPIFALPVYPCKYMDKSDGGKARELLLELGEKYYGIVRDSPTHMKYAGSSWLGNGTSRRDGQRNFDKPDTEYVGEIIIDHRKNTGINPRSRGPRSISPVYIAEEDMDDNAFDERLDEENDGHELPEFDARMPQRSFQIVNPEFHPHLTPLHYFLLPRRMGGFALASKQRMEFDVEKITPMTWPPKESDPMGTLILQDSDKDVIKALARKYSKHEGTWGADFIEGKGEGQIFLLHGPPGTGKTYTVECVAKFTRRPLLRLTVADIGTDERDMEEILGEWFQRGADWGAIILIDEADVFLEKRQVKDLQRNSLVSVFLSSMEYYTGMLFLTTNRIGQIDDAFLSRTSVALTYEKLDAGKQQRIWDGFLKKLAEERKDITLTDRAKKFLENLDKDDATHDPWNGREIRNALQTAIALASYDAEQEAEAMGTKLGRIVVRDEHFQMVVDRRKDFVAYRKSIRNQDEDARAYSEGNRAMPKRGGRDEYGRGR